MRAAPSIPLLPFPATLSVAIVLLLIAISTPACGQTDPNAKKEPVKPTVTHLVRLTTSMGEIELELYGEDAPMTVANFVALVDSGFYDGILFHRVHPGFLIQAGDPGTKDSTIAKGKWGMGGKSIYGGPFPDEIDPGKPSYKQGYTRGTLAMANNGPNMNTSQFFILLNDIPKLPKKNTIFGHVSKGMEVVDSIAAVELTDFTDYGGKPRTPVVILNAKSLPLPKEELKGE